MTSMELFEALKGFNRLAKIYLNINGERYEINLNVGELMDTLKSAPRGLTPSESKFHSDITGIWSWAADDSNGKRDIDREKSQTPYVVLQTNLSIDRTDIGRSRESDIMDYPVGCPAVC